MLCVVCECFFASLFCPWFGGIIKGKHQQTIDWFRLCQRFRLSDVIFSAIVVAVGVAAAAVDLVQVVPT